MKKDKENKPKKVIEEVIRNGRCLKCGKPMVKNHQSCVQCRRKIRLRKKANRRGKPRDYYLR
jgi:uncharacterized OB-fold protein